MTTTEQETTRVCRVTGEPFAISPLERELCRKTGLPLPTINKTERLRRLCSFANYLNLFQGTCQLSGDKILQNFRAPTRFPVYSVPAWWSDEWSASDYARPYNFKLNFFDQIDSLLTVVPQPALNVQYSTLENSDYINGASNAKNSYLSMLLYNVEDVFYCYGAFRSRDCIGCVSVYDCELCYDCAAVFNSYNLRHSFNCRNCRDSAFLWNSVGCSDCFGCINLRHKRFCFFNEQLSEEGYRARLSELPPDSHRTVEHWKRKFQEFAKQQLQPSMHGLEVQGCTGDFLSYSCNAENCFDSASLQDCVNCLRVEKSKDCIDYYSWGSSCELIARTTRAGYDSQNIRMSVVCYLSSSDLEYCVQCIGCRNCFGCVGLRNQEHCILNQRYSPAEYQELRARIVNQMAVHGAINPNQAYGEMFPYRLSPFAYNDSDAQIYLPLAKEEAIQRQARWEKPDFAAGGGVEALELPDRTSETTPENLSGLFRCALSGRPYRISKAELKIHQKLNVPLPRRHWRQHVLDLCALKNSPMLHEHQCVLTARKILSAYPPQEGWLVCEHDAYIKEFGA